MSLFEAKPQAADRPMPDAMYRLALAALPMPVAILDPLGCWQYLNPAAEQQLGRSLQHVRGTQASPLFHADDRAVLDSAIDAVAQGTRPAADTAVRWQPAGGPSTRMQLTLSPFALDGRPGRAEQHVLVTIRETTGEPVPGDAGPANDPDPTAASAVDLEARAARASRKQLQMFADAVAHDLRAPLRSIESFAGLLDKRSGTQLDDTARDHLQRIRAAAVRMGGLLVGLGDLSTATRGEIKSMPVDLTLLADWVLAELQDAEPGRDAELEVASDLWAQGDERLLKLMFAHVLGNAWKFSQGDAPTRIVVDGETRDGRVHLRVRDHGSGFDMRYAHKLFEPFQRLHGPDAGGGHGLGLAAAHRIVERHGGTLRGESVPGQGATFHIELPAALAAEDIADAQGHPAG
ncbi:ATP-binding protein [Lysobacter sp. A3-1-A15]|uniref:ATP-binding protein n=1 Tax=Novilysobacter viscosus TaxID=3098602 RepID=UPI002EDAB7A0